METAPRLSFQYGWDERDDLKTPLKGCRSDGLVSFAYGTTYSVYFIDPIRLKQDLEEEVKCGSPFLAVPGLIVLPELTRKAMENAISLLWKQGICPLRARENRDRSYPPRFSYGKTSFLGNS